jgi:hypothetical protein
MEQWHLGVFMAGGLVLFGCNTVSSLSGDKKTDVEEEPPPKAAASAAPAATAIAPAAATSAAPAETAAPPPTDTPLPEGRTPVPTQEEWDALPKEVTVKGSSALNCETKMIREYLRVWCRGKNDTGGTPQTIEVKKGGSAGALTAVANGEVTLIVPFVNGTDFAAVFSWTDKSHRLAVRWPNGAPMPSVKGIFEGAASPIDAHFDRATQERLCQCVKETMGTSTCSDGLSSPNVDCYKTYQSDCGKLVACSRGERSVPPRCQYGYVNGGALNWCMKKCGPKDPCADGERCINDGRNSYCM